MRYALFCFVAVLAAEMPAICDASVLTCFGRGVFDINAALDDSNSGTEFQGLSNVYAPHGAQVIKPDDQFSVDAIGLPYSGFSVDLGTSQYREHAEEGDEHY